MSSSIVISFFSSTIIMGYYSGWAESAGGLNTSSHAFASSII